MKTSSFFSGRVITGYIGSLLIIACVLAFSSCSKDDDGPSGNSYPRTVDITYRVSLTSGSVTSVNSINYDNETGGNDGLVNVPLPFSKTIRRTVQRSTIIALGAMHNNSASGAFGMKLEILVDGELVETESFSHPSAINAAIAYGFN